MSSSLATLGSAGTLSEDQSEPLFTPSHVESAPTHRFIGRVNAKYGLSLETYHDLYRWSTTEVDRFWSEVWDFTDVVGHKGTHVVDMTATPPDNPAWFAEAQLNWAENMLRCRSPAKTALVEASGSPFFELRYRTLKYTRASRATSSRPEACTPSRQLCRAVHARIRPRLGPTCTGFETRRPCGFVLLKLYCECPLLALMLHCTSVLCCLCHGAAHSPRTVVP